MRKVRVVSNIIMYIVLTIIVIFTLFPLFYMLMASFKTSSEIMISSGKILPESFNWNNYKEIWNSPNFDIARLFFNTLIYTISNVAIQLFLSVTLGYVFEVGRFKFKKLIFTCFTALMFIKTGGIGIYAKFEILDALHIPINLYALIGLGLFSIPIVNIFLVRGYIKSLPKGIDEAARIDGCGFSGVLFKVYLPLLKPIIATILILSFNSYWNDYLTVSYYTASMPSQRTLSVGLMALKDGGAGTQWNLLLAGATVSVIPVLFVYAFCSRYFVQGLSAGAVKG